MGPTNVYFRIHLPPLNVGTFTIHLSVWENNFQVNVGKYTSPMDPMGYE